MLQVVDDLGVKVEKMVKEALLIKIPLFTFMRKKAKYGEQ
jgi:hypothetical protein